MTVLWQGQQESGQSLPPLLLHPSQAFRGCCPAADALNGRSGGIGHAQATAEIALDRVDVVLLEREKMYLRRRSG